MPTDPHAFVQSAREHASRPCDALPVVRRRRQRADHRVGGRPDELFGVLASESDALARPRGNLLLVCCVVCGQLYNATFDAGLPTTPATSRRSRRRGTISPFRETWRSDGSTGTASRCRRGRGRVRPRGAVSPSLLRLLRRNGRRDRTVGLALHRRRHVRFVPELLVRSTCRSPDGTGLSSHARAHLRCARVSRPRPRVVVRKRSRGGPLRGARRRANPARRGVLGRLLRARHVLHDRDAHGALRSRRLRDRAVRQSLPRRVHRPRGRRDERSPSAAHRCR